MKSTQNEPVKGAVSLIGLTAISLVGFAMFNYNAPHSISNGPQFSAITVNGDDPAVAGKIEVLQAHDVNHADQLTAEHAKSIEQDAKIAEGAATMLDFAVEQASLKEQVAKSQPRPNTSNPIPGWNGRLDMITTRQVAGNAKMIAQCQNFVAPDGSIVHGNLFSLPDGRFVLVKHRAADLPPAAVASQPQRQTR